MENQTRNSNTQKNKEGDCMNERIRLNLALPRRDMEILNETVELENSGSKTETIKRAIKLLHEVRKQQEKRGGKFVFRPDSGKEETLLLL